MGRVWISEKVGQTVATADEGCLRTCLLAWAASLFYRWWNSALARDIFNKGTFIEAYNALGHLPYNFILPSTYTPYSEEGKYFKGPYYKTSGRKYTAISIFSCARKKENICRYLLSVYSPSEKLNVDFSTYQAKCHYSSHSWIFTKSHLCRGRTSLTFSSKTVSAQDGSPKPGWLIPSLLNLGTSRD